MSKKIIRKSKRVKTATAKPGSLHPAGSAWSWKQAERQRTRKRGRYTVMNRCCRCGKSAGADYCSSDDGLELVICFRCAKAPNDKLSDSRRARPSLATKTPKKKHDKKTETRGGCSLQ